MDISDEVHRLVGMERQLSEAEVDVEPELAADGAHDGAQGQRLATSNVEDIAAGESPFFENEANRLSDVLNSAKIADLHTRRHTKGLAFEGAAQQRWKEAIAPVMHAGKREGSNYRQVPFEAFRTGAEKAVRSRFGGSVRVEGINWIPFPAGAVLARVNESGADVNEMAAVDFAGALKEFDGGLDVQANEIEPADLSWADSAGGAMNDGVGLEVEDGLTECGSIGNVELLPVDIGEAGKKRRIGVSGEQMDAGLPMHLAEQPYDVTAEGSGRSGDEHAL
jgi:hypothetical protein